MMRGTNQWTALLIAAAIAFLPSATLSADLLPRDVILPVSEVTKSFPDVTKEAGTGPNETSVGKPVATRSVVFTSADGKKKVTLSIDQYASVGDAAAAYQTAVQGSEAAPGFEPAAAPDLGQEAFAGTSQVGAERHFGLGARDGILIMSATHAGDIPVTPENSEKLARLGGMELAAAKEMLGADGPTAAAEGKGRVTIVYQDDAIKPENREVIAAIKKSGVFERLADRLTATVALPHDLEVLVTDKLPIGVDDPNTELDGRRIFWPAAFSKDTHDALAEALPAVRAKGAPKAIARENLTAEILNIWSNQYILGHELGHAIIHQLNLPLTGLEEDSADGFATFFTVNDAETGPNAALGAALLFDAMGSKRPTLTLEDFSSDHEVILQRVYNFLCAALGSDPEGLQSLVTDGYIPELRAMMCGKEWTQLNYGWWTMLAPHLTESAKKETETVRQQARQDLVKENDALFAKFRKMRGQQ